MININLLLNHVKARLGASHKPIELSDEAIIQCLQEVTLPQLSIFMPFYCQYLITEENKVEGMPNTYYIPDEIHDFKVMAVEMLLPANGAGMNINAPYFFSPLGGDLQGIVANMASYKFTNNLISQVVNPTTYTFIPPNMLRVYGQHSMSKMMLVLRTTHKKDFTTFPFGMMEMIKKLAFYDVALDILSVRRYFTSINTNFAQIELELDSLQVEDRREDLLQKLEKDMLKNANQRKLIIA